MTNQDDARRRAYYRAGAKLGFYFHLVAFVTVNLLLAIINFSTTPETLWFKWPLLGWGIGLVFHGFAVFVGPKIMQQAVARELENDRSSD
jgi:hypothetical protein